MQSPVAGNSMLAWLMTTPSPPPPGGLTDAAAADGGDARLAPLTAALAARLGSVCRGWDAAEFTALVDRIARTRLRWEDRGYAE